MISVGRSLSRALRASIFAAASSLLLASGARAQTGRDSTRADTLGQARRDSARTLARVTVRDRAGRPNSYLARQSSSATRTATPLRDVPQSVSVVSSSQVRDQAMQSMADVARAVPGVTMALGEGHRDAPTIRGNSTTADFFVDGVRDDAQYLRDLYNTDRVEVLKGANALSFGRGGGGGVINRVTREAQWTPSRTIVLEGGSFAHARGSVDAGSALGAHAAVRMNGVYENSEGFRDGVRLERSGVNPTLALRAGARTIIRAGYEYFRDDRTVDRGIPSFAGAPSPAPITTTFGDARTNRSTVGVNAATATVEHDNAHGFTVRNRTRFADYEKYYGNVFTGAVEPTGARVSLQAYDHAINRRNAFNQTDVTFRAATGGVSHQLLVGAEAGRQRTEQFRNTGYFSNSATSVSVPFPSSGTIAPVTFRQSATDANSWSNTTVVSGYVQDQAELTSQVQLIAGVRYERFNVRYHNNRNDTELTRQDALVSPRAGIVVKPVLPLSLYGSFGVSFLPGSGDQFTTLTVTSQQLAPERFTNREVGLKWDPTPAISVTSAVYRLDRTNTSAPDPLDASRVVQTGAQRTKGVEAGITGDITNAWQVAAGYTVQDARILSTTSASKAGASVPLVPRSTLSLWNRYDVRPRTGVGIGVVHQAAMYAAIDNSVKLPKFTRLDGAIFLPAFRGLRAQANVENLLNTRYYGTSHGNNNIMPGATRTLRVSLSTRLGGDR